MDGFVSWLRQLQFDGVWQTALLVAASLLCITFHETCHGLAAYRLGDPTAKRAGRLTLNPLRHVDIGGLLMMALFRFGWAKPVPVDMRNFKHPKRDMALTAAAGPVSNVLLAYLAVLLRGLCSVWYYVSGSMAVYALALFFYYVEIISAGLAGFNEVFGVQHRLLEGISGGNGYTAILVALLALNHPLRVMLVSIGLAALQVGAATMQRTLGIPSSIVSIIIGFIVLMILCGSLPQIWAENRPSQSVKKERGKHVG